MFTKRLLERVAMLMIGDSVIGMTNPRRHVLLWKGGPKPWQRIVDSCARHTGLTRSIGALGLVAGLWLALRQTSGITSR